MTRAVWLLENGSENDGIVLIESQLLGALMLCPYLRLDCEALRPTDFKGRHRGIAFQAIMTEKRPELGLIVARLEAEGHQPPPGRTGWGDALSRLLDVALIDDDSVRDAVRRVREAALARRLEERTHAA